MGRNEEALAILRVYCDLAMDLNDNDGLSRTYSHMGAIYRKMGLHREGTEMFAKAKALNGDMKNVVGDQPLSENMLSTMVLPSAAARKNRTLEVLEEISSSELSDTSLDTSLHTCSPIRSRDLRDDAWEKTIDLSLQIHLETPRDLMTGEDEDLTSPLCDTGSDDSSSHVSECEEPDTESALNHRDQEGVQEKTLWEHDIAAANSAERNLLISLSLPAIVDRQCQGHLDEVDANEDDRAADAAGEGGMSLKKAEVDEVGANGDGAAEDGAADADEEAEMDEVVANGDGAAEGPVVDAAREGGTSPKKAEVVETWRIEKEEVDTKAKEAREIAEAMEIAARQRHLLAADAFLSDAKHWVGQRNAERARAARASAFYQLECAGADADHSLSSLDLEISALVTSIEQETGQDSAHVVVALQAVVGWEQASMLVEADATSLEATAPAAGGLSEEAMAANCLEWRVRAGSDIEPALLANAEAPVAMPAADGLVQEQTESQVDAMQGCDAAIDATNPQMSSSVSPRQPASSEIARNLHMTKVVGSGHETKTDTPRSLMYSWLHSQRKPQESSATREHSLLPPSAWVPEQVASEVAAAAVRIQQALAWQDSSASEDSRSNSPPTGLQSKMFGWLHVDQSVSPRNKRSVQSPPPAQGSSPRTSSLQISGHARSPPPDPQVNPQGNGNSGYVGQSSLTPRSTVRPKGHEVTVDCYWLPELNTGSDLNTGTAAHEFAAWMICPADAGGKAETSPRSRSLSPVLIPECESHNLVSLSVLDDDSARHDVPCLKPEPSSGPVQMRYLF